MSVEPKRPERVYAAGPAGVFRSNDAGQTWERAQEGLHDVAIVSLSVDPKMPDRVYAATADSRFFQSDDGGNSWRPLKGSDAG